VYSIRFGIRSFAQDADIKYDCLKVGGYGAHDDLEKGACAYTCFLGDGIDAVKVAVIPHVIPFRRVCVLSYVPLHSVQACSSENTVTAQLKYYWLRLAK
jgi:hypothetical protein